jgi:hypothetical protein
LGVDDYMDREAGILAAATAAAVSPRARDLFRRGAVYGLAGVLKAGDVAVAAARGAVRGTKDGATGASGTPDESKPVARQRNQRTGTTSARSRQRRSGTKSS